MYNISSTKITNTFNMDNHVTADQFISVLTSLPSKSTAGTTKFYEHIDKGNKFLGVRMAAIFDLAKQFKQMPPGEIEKLLNSEYYEQRMGAVSIMDFQARDKKVPDSRKKELYTLYIKRHDKIN